MSPRFSGYNTSTRRSNAAIALAVERTLGKGKVIGSNPIGGSWKLGRVVEGAALEMLLGGLPLPGFESLSFRLHTVRQAILRTVLPTSAAETRNHTLRGRC